MEDQIRTARARLRLEQGELARRARAAALTIRPIERTNGAWSVARETIETVRQALGQAVAGFIPGSVRRRRIARPNARSRYEDLQAISRSSAARLQGREMLSDADLHDEDGLPA